MAGVGQVGAASCRRYQHFQRRADWMRFSIYRYLIVKDRNLDSICWQLIQLTFLQRSVLLSRTMRLLSWLISQLSVLVCQRLAGIEATREPSQLPAGLFRALNSICSTRSSSFPNSVVSMSLSGTPPDIDILLGSHHESYLRYQSQWPCPRAGDC